MAHHQGMSLLAFSYLLHDQPMQQRFVADPLFQATLLLLQERIPKPTASYLQIPKSPHGAVLLTIVQKHPCGYLTPPTHAPRKSSCYPMDIIIWCLRKQVVVTAAGKILQ